MPASFHRRPVVCRLLTALTLALSAFSTAPARAFVLGETVYWNGGDATWDTANAEWTTDATLATGFDIWDNSLHLAAKFTGPAGTITLSTPINFGSLTFDTGGYTITGSTLNATASGIGLGFFYANTGTTTIESAITGSALLKYGAGTLTLKGANTYTGLTDIYAGTLTLDGGSITNTIDGGARIRLYQADSTFLVQSGTVTSFGIQAEQGGVTVTGASSVMNLQTFQLGNNGLKPADATLEVSNGATFTSAGAGLVGQSGNGRLTISGSDTQFTSGSLSIGGTVDTTSSVLQTGGTATYTGSISIGSFAVGAGGTASYVLEGGTLVAGAGIIAMTAGNNTFELAGGTVKANAASISIANASTRADTTSYLNANGNTFVFSGTLSGPGALVKNGAGNLTLNNTGSDFSGGLTVNDGGLVTVGTDTALGTGGVVFSTDARLQGGGTDGVRTVDSLITLNNGAVLTLDAVADSFYSGGSLALAGAIGGNGGLAINSTSFGGKVELAGNNTFGGGTTLTSGNLVIGHDNALGGGGLTIAGGSFSAHGTHAITNAVTINDGVTANFNSASDLALNGTLGGSGSLAVMGTTVLTLGGDNHDFTGEITVGNIFDGGILRITNAGALGSSAGGTTVSYNSSLILDNVALSGEPLTLQGDGDGLGGAVSLSATGTSSVSGDINTGYATFGGSGTLTVSGNLLGGDNEYNYITKVGSGTLILSGDNTFTGGSWVREGTMALASNGAISSASLSSTDVEAGATLQLQGGITVTGAPLILYATSGVGGNGGLRNTSGNNTWAGAITLAGDSRIQSDAGTLTLAGDIDGDSGLNIGGAGHTRITGRILDGSLVKDGAGTLTLTRVNTYTGDTTVSAGTLVVNGSLGNTAVTVNNNATLGGTGTIGGLTTLDEGAHLAPGNSPGTLTFTNGLSLADGSILDFQLGSSSDLIRVSGGLLTGSASLNGLTLNLSDAGGFTASTYVLFDFTGAALSSFDTTDFSLGTTIAGFDYSFAITGSTLQLISTAAIPEPATYAALAGLAAFGFILLRRRRA